jgi:glycosyltransferase involved in cell wall biosynthesis
MTELSIIVPFKNEFDEIDGFLRSLQNTIPAKDAEIIIVNDGSVFGSGKFRPLELSHPNVRVINNPVSFGVGYAFDRGVEQAQGEVLVLAGSDVYPRMGWYDKVMDAIKSNPNTLGCSTCVGLNMERLDLDNPKNFRRYGAELLFTVSEDDLPVYSPLRNMKGEYTSLFHAKWMFSQLSKEPYEIPCVLGAFYFTSKKYYELLGGFDTQPGNRYRGHIQWAHLEPYISLKSWLVGGGCTLYPDIEAGHVFARITKKDRFKKGVRSAEWMWRNALFILETQILDEELRRKLYKFLHYELNLGEAKKMISQHYKEVVDIRYRNSLMFINEPKIFTDKFGYKLRI